MSKKYTWYIKYLYPNREVHSVIKIQVNNQKELKIKAE